MPSNPYILPGFKTKIWLLPEKAMWLPDYKTLIIADWHLGKLAHFRKHGIFIPKNVFENEFAALHQLIEEYQPKKIIFLGDLFHSETNGDWLQLANSLSAYPHITFILTKGNHDVIEEYAYNQANIILKKSITINDELLFTHEPLKKPNGDLINIVGHIHPGIVLTLKGKQHFRLPIFYKLHQLFIMPAFGKHTGLHILDQQSDADIYVILGDEIRLLAKS